MSTELVILSNHLIFCRPLLLLPSIFPSIRVFSNEPALHIVLWYPLSLPQSHGASVASQDKRQFLGRSQPHPLQNLPRGSHSLMYKMCANHPDLNPVALPPQVHHTCYFPGPCLRLGFSSSPCVPKLQPVAPLKIIYHYLSKTFHSLEVLSSMNKHVHQGAFLTQRVLVISIKSILPDSGPPDAVQKP